MYSTDLDVQQLGRLCLRRRWMGKLFQLWIRFYVYNNFIFNLVFLMIRIACPKRQLTGLKPLNRTVLMIRNLNQNRKLMKQMKKLTPTTNLHSNQTPMSLPMSFTIRRVRYVYDSPISMWLSKTLTLHCRARLWERNLSKRLGIKCMTKRLAQTYGKLATFWR